MVSKNDIKFMKCSHFHRNKRNNICKTSSTPPHRIPIDRVICREIKHMLLYDWCNAVKQKIFYKDQVVRCRLRRRRRRSRPPTKSIL